MKGRITRKRFMFDVIVSTKIFLILSPSTTCHTGDAMSPGINQSSGKVDILVDAGFASFLKKPEQGRTFRYARLAPNKNDNA